MESQQLMLGNLMTATLLATPVSADLSTSHQDGHQQSSQSLQGLPAAGIPLQETVLTGNDIINIEPLLQNNGENLWMNNPVQYVVIHKDDQEAITGAADTQDTALTDNDKFSGMDRLQCGLCGKIQDNVLLFLHHKSAHVARGMGLGCEICGLSFSRQLALTEHYRRKHRILLNEKKRTREALRSVKHHKKPPSTLSLHLTSSPETLQGEYTGQLVGNDIRSDQTEFVQLTGSTNPAEAYLASSVEALADSTRVECKKVLSAYEFHRHLEPSCTQPSSSHVMDSSVETLADSSQVMDNSTDMADSESASHMVDCLNTSVSTTVGESQESGESQAHYLYACTRPEESVLETSNVELHTDPHAAGETPIDGDEPDDTTIHTDCDMNIIAAPTVVIATELSGNEIEMVDTVNSDSSEKENSRDVCLSDDQNSEALVKQTKNNSVMEPSGTALKKGKSLTVELNMQDFHFIPVIESKSKRGIIQGGRYSFKCLYCDLKVSWKSTMCKHMKEKHADILKVGPLLNIPDKVNGGHEVMKMSEYIKLELKPSGKRVRGVESQDMPGEYLCDKCDKIFYRLRYLRKHQAVHKTEKNLLCSMCVKSFKTLGNLKQHMKTHKNRDAYKCSECDFESSVNIAIHAHRQIHCQGCVLCEVCGSAYSDKSTLNKHKQVHNPMRPFACDYPGCTWRFKTKAMCSAHFRAHTTKGTFECSVCGYAFRQKHHLQRHERKVHNIIEERKPSYSYLEPSVLSYSREKEGDQLDVGGSSAVQEVNLIVNEANEVSVDTVEDQFDLESALQTGQLVIATEDGSTINCEMSDIGMNMSYQTLLQDGDAAHLDSHTILIPHTDGSHIVYQHEEVTETVADTEETESTKV